MKGNKGAGTISDHCTLYSKKEFSSYIPDYVINPHGFKFCGEEAIIEAIGPDLPNAIFSWKFDNSYNSNLSFSGQNGKVIVVHAPGSPATSVGQITLTVSLDCISKQFTYGISPSSCIPPGMTGGTVAVFPNPAQDGISVAFLDPNYYVPEGGLEMRIIHANSGTLVKTGRLYSNISAVNTSTLTNGSYTLQVLTTDGSSISTAFTILKN